MNDQIKQMFLERIESDRIVSKQNRFLDLDTNKLRGGYYTPATIAAWISSWAIRDSTDKVLEPSCGDGTFLEEAAKRLLTLGTKPSHLKKSLRAVELIDAEAEIAQSRLSKHIGKYANEAIEVDDFFSWFQRTESKDFTAVVGNPPFIRYQTFPEPYRTRAMQIMVSMGMKPNKLTNIWVPFVVASAACLRPGGRMALVLPAEILQVTYASQLRSYLTDKFTRVDVITCNELFFENAEQEVVIILADGAIQTPSAKNICRVAMSETKTVAGLLAQSPTSLLSVAVPKIIRHDSEKWLKYFLSQKEIDLMRKLRESNIACSLFQHASIDVGVVTGKNEFFVLSSEQVKAFDLTGYTIPIVSRSSQMKGASISVEELEEISTGSDRVHLLHLGPFLGKKLKKGLLNYIQYGEDQGFHLGYKCSIRTPWYVVPSVWTPDALLFRQIYDFPRVIKNIAEATSTDTIHRLRSTAPTDHLLPNLYTYLSGASAEIEGRSYGGGVLELEPTEAERMLMPSTLQTGLSLNEIDAFVRQNRLEEALEENSRRILVDGLGISNTDCRMLKAIWIKMRDRRLSRKKRSH